MGGFINDGIGHSRASATPLPRIGNSVDFNLAKGVIVPVSSSSPAAVGSANYQPDYWSFTTTGGLVTLTANSGEEYLTPGIADPGATLKTLLTIYNSSGNVVATSSTTLLSETISSTLAAGTYYASVTAVGDAIDNRYYPRDFFDQGPFFLTGTVPAAVPGDFNGNGVVDAADYVVWRNGLGTTYTQSDYNTWRSHFGQTAGSGAGATATAAVPEPVTFLLLMFAVASCCVLRSRACIKSPSNSLTRDTCQQATV